MNSSIEVVTTWESFRRNWHNRQNFIVRGELFPFQYQPRPLAQVLEGVRSHLKTRIMHGQPNTEMVFEPFPEYRDLAIEDALLAPASVAHFDVREFSARGQVLEGLGGIIDRWYDSLASHGFEWSSSQRAFFYSAAQCTTGYHYDSSYVLAWQITGRKRFCWLKDPERWCPAELRRDTADYYEKMRRPEGITSDDVIECEMQPGDVLWNIMLTPHWVYSLDEPTWSLNITHFDLKCEGVLSDISLELEDIRRERNAVAA